MYATQPWKDICTQFIICDDNLYYKLILTMKESNQKIEKIFEDKKKFNAFRDALLKSLETKEKIEIEGFSSSTK